MASITMKRGDTFRRTLTLLKDGVPVDITPFSIRVQIRKPNGELLAVPTVTNLDQTGLYIGKADVFVPYTATALWDPGQYACDVELTLNSERMSSATVNVNVIGDITQ
jgi:hypothetical protein